MKKLTLLPILCLTFCTSLTYAGTYPYASGPNYDPNEVDAWRAQQEQQAGQPFNGPSVSYYTHHHRHNGGIHWVDAYQGSGLPYGAVLGGSQPGSQYGSQRITLYVCRANYADGMHPGKLLAGMCNISYDHQEIPMTHYQILTSNRPLRWVPASYGYVPENAVIGGYEHGDALYVCQARYQNGVHPGKIVSQACNIAWGGKEIPMSYYNVLVN